MRPTKSGVAPASGVPLRQLSCPLCGEDNGCVPAARGDFDAECWCTSVTFDRSLVERVPIGQRGLACICRHCAERASAFAADIAAPRAIDADSGESR